MNNLLKEMPAVALRGACVLPGMIAHFDISREKSKQAVNNAMMGGQYIFLVTQKDVDVEDPGINDIYGIGTISQVKQVVKLPKGMVRILIEGIERAEVVSLQKEQSYLEAEVLCFDMSGEVYPQGEEKEAMERNLRDLFITYCNGNPGFGRELAEKILDQEDLEKLLDQIGINLPLPVEKKQKILEAITLQERFDVISVLLANEVEIGKIRLELQEKIKERIDKNQKDYILREQLKVIREELGDDTSDSDADIFRQKLKKLKASKEVKEKISEAIDRFTRTAQASPESAVMRGYIETLIALPWDKASKDNEDLKRAREILDRDHYGLKKVKERILEFLAVRHLTEKGTSPILCLVGPPGTGKTSIGKSIAEALGKKYQRLSLGGVHDEAEIRGHRRTYVGAMPGRIATALKNAGVKNPIIVLDEVDKVGADYRGDVSSALLEVLDSEQNVKFADHYVEIPLDLSEVLFIATANDAQTIPQPLLDRMEVIEVSGYTDNEKAHIAKEHLIPKQKATNGLTDEMISFTDKALDKLINEYTREAGVRQLERVIGQICRKSARLILEENKKKITVTEKNIASFLGNGIHSTIPANEKDEIGIVRGLAWTAVGGETLQVEVNLMPGKGEFLLTGQLGDVMKESAQAGISYIRSVADKYDVGQEFFQKHDIHIHIPEGAIPKDGPSAGITMATAMLSALTMTPVKANVAMTGEITLRGRVLPIGGLKEKLLAAKKAGMKTVIVPEKNRKNVKEIDKEITGGLRIVYADCMDQVLKAAFANKPGKKIQE